MWNHLVWWLRGGREGGSGGACYGVLCGIACVVCKIANAWVQDSAAYNNCAASLWPPLNVFNLIDWSPGLWHRSALHTGMLLLTQTQR